MSNSSQYDRLLQEVSRKIGASPDSLRSAAQSGSFDNLVSSLNTKDAARICSLIENKSELEKMVNSPKMQEWIKKLNEGK